jgi:hypothetical protein
VEAEHTSGEVEHTSGEVEHTLAVGPGLAVEHTLAAGRDLAEHRACPRSGRVHHFDRLSLPGRPLGRWPHLFAVPIQ